MRDFIDVYIRELNLSANKKTTFSCEFSLHLFDIWLMYFWHTILPDPQLCTICMDLFIAGTETTSSTIGYCMRYMLQYPHIQHKLRDELLREIGRERLPTMEDMTK